MIMTIHFSGQQTEQSLRFWSKVSWHVQIGLILSI